MIQFYLVHAVANRRNGIDIPNSQTAEHFGAGIAGVDAAYMPFGSEGTMLVCADTDEATHVTLAALPRVVQIPADLDQTLTAGQVTAVSNFLETRNIPAHWIDTNRTIREVLRGIVGVFQFAQVYHSLHNLTLFRGGVTLDTRMNQISATERNRLTEAAAAANLSTAGIALSSTVRQVLNVFGSQWLDREVYLGKGVI